MCSEICVSIYDYRLIDELERLGIAYPCLDDEENGIVFLMSTEDELAVFREQFLLSKEQILSRIDKEKEKLKTSEDGEEGYRKVLMRLYDQLYEQVKDSTLFDAPSGFWHYLIEHDSMEMRLKLVNDENGYVSQSLEYITDDTGDEYTMFAVPAKSLTIEEYAVLYGVEAVTVRQWIRRGKIRTAYKVGNEWRIPELAEIPNKSRGYHRAQYSWNVDLNNVPEGYAFMNQYDHVSIYQSGKEFVMKFWEEEKFTDAKEVTCTTAEKERVELFLISNPFVKYEGESCFVIDRK